MVQADDVFLSTWLPHDAGSKADLGAAAGLSWSGGKVVGVQIRDKLVAFVAAPSGLANVTTLDLTEGSGLTWGASPLKLHACGLAAGTWETGTGKALGTVSGPSFCLVVSVVKPDLEGGALQVKAS